MDTTKVGFYLSVNMGLTFNIETLTQLYKCYREFKNSVFIVYDVSKSDYGLNPLHCFRLSEKAIEAFDKGAAGAPGVVTSDRVNLLQEKIKAQNLTISELFEEVQIRVYRSHLVQAFLFDHIQPHMPAFNANMFKLATPQYLCNHVFQLNEATDELIHEQQKLETTHKNTLKMHKKNQYKQGDKHQLEESQGNKIDLFLLSRQVDELCN
jgi:C-terminal region of eIF3h